MTDRYAKLARSPLGAPLKRIGLPEPPALQRHRPGDPVVDGPVLLAAAPGGRLAGPAAAVLAGARAEVHTPLDDEVRRAAADAGLDAGVFNAQTAGSGETFKAVVFDASGIASTDGLDALHAFFGDAIRRVRPSGRVILLGAPPATMGTTGGAIAQRALEGFLRSAAKEVRAGATAQLVVVEPGGEQALASTLRFFLSPRSAYVSGQVVRIGQPVGLVPDIDWERPLDGRVALVTGASRGIGAAIASTLARDGAHVVGVDVPAAERDLRAVAQGLNGSWLTADITDAGAPKAITGHLRSEHGGVDVVVHNAGITRDRSLARMSADEWGAVLDVNLRAVERLTDALLAARGVLHTGARIVGVSSISGIAGNAGQANYATSKAGVIGFVDALAAVLAERESTVNAVAPGFIETQMTARIPFATREAGRRMNSLRQGGLPVDVAETIAWLASPASVAVTGNVVRVCGQSLLGA